jgi:neutral ceramidase
MTQISAGASRIDITIFDRDAELMGWAQPTNRAKGVSTPLNARAFVLRDEATGAKTVMVTAELCFIADSVRHHVWERIKDIEGMSEERTLLMATHTHSGPGGFTYDLVYTLTTPGFRPRILTHIVDGIVSAIMEADSRRVPAKVRFIDRPIPHHEPVAFNRSPDAYSANPDVQAVPWRDRQLATNRQMPVLLMETMDGTGIGELNFFAVHCTSVHSDYKWVSSDNKGYASSMVEEAIGGDFVAAFSQGAAGDVSPNFRFDKHRGFRVGMYDDDFASARFVGEIQGAHCLSLMSDRSSQRELAPVLDGALMRFDFSNFCVDPRFAGGRKGRRTGASRVGMGFLEGTEEGPGPMLRVKGINQFLHRSIGVAKRVARRIGRSEDGIDDSQGGKWTFLETGRGGAGKAFEFFSMGNPEAPDWLDPTVAEARRLNNADALGDRPWTQHVLPVQILRIGDIAIAALPNEPTTVSGYRIQRQLEAALRASGIRDVVIAGYANGYASYLTTYEEYQLQKYEGSSNLHGQWSLAAFQTAFDRVAQRLSAPREERNADLGPVHAMPSEHELNVRANWVELRYSPFR